MRKFKLQIIPSPPSISLSLYVDLADEADTPSALHPYQILLDPGEKEKEEGEGEDPEDWPKQAGPDPARAEEEAREIRRRLAKVFRPLGRSDPGPGPGPRRSRARWDARAGLAVVEQQAGMQWSFMGHREGRKEN